MSTVSRPQGKATYVASNAERYWLLTEQRKLYTRSWEKPRYTFAKLWGLVTDLRNLRCALMRVSRNKGSRTAGVDRVTVRRILAEDPEEYLKRGVHGALEHARKFLKSPKLKEGTETEVELGYQVAIEADVKGCFDNLSHHGIMTRIRRRISDNKVNRLILSFLQAGAMSEEGFLRTQSGTPQGGILTPPTQ